jgi:hypothetical protein
MAKSSARLLSVGEAPIRIGVTKPLRQSPIECAD